MKVSRPRHRAIKPRQRNLSCQGVSSQADVTRPELLRQVGLGPAEEQVSNLAKADVDSELGFKSLKGFETELRQRNVAWIRERCPHPTQRLRRGARSEQVLFNDQDASSPSACQMERRTDTHDAATDDRYRGVRGQRLGWAGQFHRVMSAIKQSRPRERLGANGNLFQRG
jgi:hypothetical protein